MDRNFYLRLALIGNAMLALLVGVALMYVGANLMLSPEVHVASLGPVSWWPGFAAGAALAVYGVVVLRESTLRRLSRRHARVASGIDFAFAFGVLAVVIHVPGALGLAGNLFALFLAAAMVINGLAQWTTADRLSSPVR